MIFTTQDSRVKIRHRITVKLCSFCGIFSYPVSVRGIREMHFMVVAFDLFCNPKFQPRSLAIKHVEIAV